MKILIQSLLICVLLITSCEKNNNCCDQLPDCINEMINRAGDSPPLVSVKMQKVDGECHYWLNTGASAWDGVEYIVNDKCDTICEIGGFRAPLDCSKNYDFDKWEIVWEK